MCGTNDERMSAKFFISGILPRIAREKGNKKGRKNDLVNQRVTAYWNALFCKIKPNNLLSHLLPHSGADFPFSVNISLRPAAVLPCPLRTQAQPNSCGGPGYALLGFRKRAE